MNSSISIGQPTNSTRRRFRADPTPLLGPAFLHARLILEGIAIYERIDSPGEKSPLAVMIVCDRRECPIGKAREPLFRTARRDRADRAIPVPRRGNS